MNTPWGKADHVDLVAPGITSVSTPSHGGYHLDPVRMSAVHARFPHFGTFAGGPWFEEDCDWAVVALTFPELFDEDNLRAAIRIAERQARTAGQRKEGNSQIKFSAYDNGWLTVGTWLTGDAVGVLLKQRVEQADGFDSAGLPIGHHATQACASGGQ